jgi:rhomboid protease GluP
MGVTNDEVLFWSISKHLLNKESYNLIKSEDNSSILWFIKNDKSTVIRVSINDFLWKKDLQKDILMFHANSHNKVAKNNEETQFVNLYICKKLPYEWNNEGPILYFRENNIHHILVEDNISDYELSSFLLGQVINSPIFIIDNIEETRSDLLNKLNNSNQQKLIYTKSILNYSRPFFTYILVALIVAVFIIVEKGDSTNINNLIDYGAKFNPLIMQGEWTRFIKPIFLHIGIFHLIMNSIALYFLGLDVEKVYGKFRFLVIFFISGIFGVLSSFIFSTGVSAGASGAIFGLIGALFYFSQRHSKILRKSYKLNIIGLIIINIAFGFTAEGIDQAAHIGGLIGGYLSAIAVQLPQDKRPLIQSSSFILLSLIFAIGLTVGFKVNSNSSENLYLIGQYYLKKEEYNKAYSLVIKDINKVEDPTSELYFLLGYLEVKQDNLSDALEHFKVAVKIDNSNDTAYYNLALISLELRNLSEAYEYISKAENIDPDNTKYINLKQKLKKYKEL